MPKEYLRNIQGIPKNAEGMPKEYLRNTWGISRESLRNT